MAVQCMSTDGRLVSVIEVGLILPDSTPESFTWTVEDFFSYPQDQANYYLRSPYFFAVGAKWWLRIYPSVNVDGSSRTRLNLCMNSSVVARFEFGIRGRDDVELMAGSGEARDRGLGIVGFLELPPHWRLYQEDFAPGGVLAVFCRLRVRGAPRWPPATLGKDTTGTQTEDFSEVSQGCVDGPSKSCNSPGALKVVEHLKGLLSSEELCDVTLKVQNQEFKAHRALLAARSSVFRAMFCHEMSEKLSKEVHITDCDPDAFRIFLRHVYTGDAEDLSVSNAFDVFSVADKYDATELMVLCKDCIASNITVKNVCDVVAFSLLHDDSVLLERASEFFTEHFNQIVLTNKWQCFLREHTTAANELLVRLSKRYTPPE